MKELAFKFSISLLFIFSSTLSAHHSFAVYDLDNKSQIKGVLTKVSVKNPHIVFSVEVQSEDGTKAEWEIESMNPNRWNSFEFPEPDTIASIGEEIAILGWAARNGDAEMALGSIITERGETEIRDFIRQGRGGNGMAMGSR